MHSRGAIKGVVATVSLMLFLFPGVAAAKPAWQKAPIVPSFTNQAKAKLKARVSRGKRLGLRSRVFAKVGDSNTEFAPNLYGLACRTPKGLPRQLRRTLRRWNQVRVANLRALPGCRPWTSFSRRSAAAQAGVFSSWSLTKISELPDVGYLRKPEGCRLNVTPLACEIDVTRPRYASVTAGTNDLGMDIGFGLVPGKQIGERLGGVVTALLKRGVVPVLSTIPPVVSADPSLQAELERGVARTNAGIWRLSNQFQVPMTNLWRAFQGPGMFQRGLARDGLHLSVSGAAGRMVGVAPESGTFADSVDFRRAALRFGANRRNLIWLKTLNRLDRITG